MRATKYMSNPQYPDNCDHTALSDSTSDVGKQNLLCQLNHLDVVEVRGSDAEKFLHGQLCNDVENLTNNTLQLNGYCDPKGRLIGLFYLIKLSDNYLIVIDQSISSSVIKRLQMFVLMAQVEFEPSQLKCIGFVHNRPKKTPDLIGQASLSPCSVSTDKNGLILAMLEGDPTRVIIIGDSLKVGSAWDSLSTDCLNCNDSVWHLLNVQLGQPSLVEKTQGTFVPQMMNLDLVNGLSFNKGCYPGQEVVARMHHLGKLKRRMYGVHIHCEEQPLAGDGIYSPQTDSASTQGHAAPRGHVAPQAHTESVGKIVSAVKVGDSEYEALAVMQIKHKEDTDLYLDDGNDTYLSITKLPYKIKES